MNFSESDNRANGRKTSQQIVKYFSNFVCLLLHRFGKVFFMSLQTVAEAKTSGNVFEQSVFAVYSLQQDIWKRSFSLSSKYFLVKMFFIQKLKFVGSVPLSWSCTKTRNSILGFFCPCRHPLRSSHLFALILAICTFEKCDNFTNLWKIFNVNIYLILLQILSSWYLLLTFESKAFCRGAALNRCPNGGLSKINRSRVAPP